MQEGSRAVPVAQVPEHLLNGQLRQVEFGAYLCSLCADLTKSLALSPFETIEVEATEILLPGHTAVRLGLIVGELVSNAFAHASPGGVPRRVHIALSRRAEGTLLLSVTDERSKLPDSRNPLVSDDVEMRLVRVLTRLLGGQICIKCSCQGTSWALSFSLVEGSRTSFSEAASCASAS